MTSGQILKKELKLSKFKFAQVQKIVNIGIPIFIITIDSRYPTTFLSYSKLAKLNSNKILKTRYFPPTLLNVGKYELNTFTLSPPTDLDDFNQRIGSNSMLIIRDLAGERYMDKKMYESKRKEGKLILKEIKNSVYKN